MKRQYRIIKNKDRDTKKIHVYFYRYILAIGIITAFVIYKKSMQNAVFSIRPYRWQNMWVFDDERVGLVKEPFVMGIPEIINKAVAHLPHPEGGFTVLFNNTGLPSPDVVLKKLDTESGGTWYEQEGTGLKGWLCPALFKYYPKAPDKLYIKVSE